MIGFVLVDKPVGPTSHDIVDVVRKTFGVRRVGHAGTLDPAASGLLVVAIGPATRLLSYVQALPKTYEVTATLGVATTTQDAAGEVVSRTDVHAGADDIRRVAKRFVGEIDQTPPSHSAVKVAGERAYAKARRGEQVDIPPRRVTVYELDVLRTSEAAFDAVVRCSSGTYIRTLVADIGKELACGAHVAHLRRTAIGHLDVRDAHPPTDLVGESLLGVEAILSHLPRLEVDDEIASQAGNGRAFEMQAPEGDVLVAGPSGIVGVFSAQGGTLRPKTVLGVQSGSR